jgi:hypothetical protein
VAVAGSVRAGAAIARQAGAVLKKSILELGGSINSQFSGDRPQARRKGCPRLCPRGSFLFFSKRSRSTARPRRTAGRARTALPALDRGVVLELLTLKRGCRAARVCMG